MHKNSYPTAVLPKIIIHCRPGGPINMPGLIISGPKKEFCFSLFAFISNQAVLDNASQHVNYIYYITINKHII